MSSAPTPINQDGLYSPEDLSGNASGDVFLNGITNGPTTVSESWNGLSNTGANLPEGTYSAQVQMRIGEYHFIAGDAETSGGPGSDGLTVYQAFSQTNLQDTLVFWDDQTFLNGTTTLPNGQLSSSPGGKHNWGNFTGGGFGNRRYIDTYVYGGVSMTTAAVIISADDTPVSVDPNLILPKRITAINRGLANQQLFDSDYVDFGNSSDEDNDVNWPGGVTSATIGSGSVESYLPGIVNGSDAGVTIRSRDKIEYTISFLSNGPTAARDVLICDLIPANTQFVPDAYNDVTPAGLGGGDRGILLNFRGTEVALTNADDGEEIPDSGVTDGVGGYYFPAGVDPSSLLGPSVSCGATNDNGAIVVDVSDVPHATGEGVPNNSYGFIRFTVTVD